MTSDKFTKDFLDFGSFTRPGMNYPDLYQHSENYGGDGQPGLQWMTQLALSAYGEYHVIDECVPEIDGTDVTGHTGYVMVTGNIVEVDIVFKTTLLTDHYLIIESDGGYATTGAKPTGVIVAKNIGGTIYNISRRESNSINYFPTGVVFYGETYHYENIIMNSYDIKGASDITGDVITGGQILGDKIEGTQITGTHLEVTNNIVVGGTVDSVDVAALKTDVDGFPDELKNLETQDITPLENINTVTVTNTQWGYLGVLDQDLRTSDNVEFAQITGAALDIAGNITVGGNVDGKDIAGHVNAGNPHSGSEPSFSKNNAFNKNFGSAASTVCVGNDGRLSDARTPVSHSYAYHSDINQALLTTSSPTFGSPTVGIINVTNRVVGKNGNNLQLTTDGAGYIGFQTNGTARWNVSIAGVFQPQLTNTYDIGSDSYAVKTIHYHFMDDLTCADFSGYTSKALYTSFKMFKGRKDGFLHHSDNTKYYFKHIDMASVPDEFATIATKDHSVQNMPRLKEGVSLNKRRYTKTDVNPKKGSIQYKKGDKCGIDFGEMTYALKDLVVKMYEEIQDLKQEVEKLKK